MENFYFFRSVLYAVRHTNEELKNDHEMCVVAFAKQHNYYGSTTA
jgi:hypothetical protein